MEGEKEAWRGQWQEGVKGICWSVAIIVISSFITSLWVKLWWRPRRIRSVLQKQGITGPKPSFPFGSISEMQRIQSQSNSPHHHHEQSDQWVYSVFPYLHKWKQQYGPIYMYSTGIKQHLYVGKPELIKELNLHTSLDLGRPSYLSKPLKPMLGAGILRANGLKWAFQRNLIAPEFFFSKIKNMADFMQESTMPIISKWDSYIIESEKGVAELVIDEDLKALTADVISRACFGSSYAQGNEIFAKLAQMQAALAKPSVLFGFLNLRIFPTKENKETWKLKKEVDTLILKVIKARQVENKESGIYEQQDLLQVLLESAATTSAAATTTSSRHTNDGDKHDMKRLIVDICKNIYFAGSESSALATAWTLMLLASHPDWQQRVRSEILQTYGNIMSPHCFQDMKKLRNLKELTMVIQESLRLYGPAVTASREALAGMKLGELEVPKGINMWLFIPALHRDPENWGADASEFKPERFAGGISEACKYPQAYIPFGLGSRICLGQNFALLEIKIVLSLLLSNFSFSLSPNYRHSPVYKMLLMPKYGVRLLVTKVARGQS